MSASFFSFLIRRPLFLVELKILKLNGEKQKKKRKRSSNRLFSCSKNFRLPYQNHSRIWKAENSFLFSPHNLQDLRKGFLARKQKTTLCSKPGFFFGRQWWQSYQNVVFTTTFKGLERCSGEKNERRLSHWAHSKPCSFFLASSHFLVSGYAHICVLFFFPRFFLRFSQLFREKHQAWLARLLDTCFFSVFFCNFCFCYSLESNGQCFCDYRWKS